MANREHVEILIEGVEVWNKWRSTNPHIIPQLDRIVLENNIFEEDLSYANLSEAYLVQSNLQGVDLSFANLRNAELMESNLSFADLYKTDLSGAGLSGAVLDGTKLKYANLSKTILRDTLFDGNDLNYAIFNEAIFYKTTLCNLDLSVIYGLDSVVHEGPSTLGIDTFLKSKGQIPDVFLLGCGIPQDEIPYLRAMAMNPIEYNSCFISYSHKDEDFARRLYSGLRDKNLRIWYAPEDMKRGQKIHEQIDAAIQVHDRLLLVLSEESMSSEWVKTEIYKARQREIKQKRRILFPISLVPFTRIKEWEFPDGDTGKDLAREIREYYIPDFSNWKDHDSFEAEFSKLLRDLKASGSESETV